MPNTPANHAYFLPLHFSRPDNRRIDTALLDKYGRSRHYNFGGREIDFSGFRMEFLRRDFAVSQRIYAILLGVGNVVDSAVVDFGILAARL